MKLKNLFFILAFTTSSLLYSIAEFEIGTSYRNDRFNWNIAGPNHNPDILSELKWWNLKIAQVEAAAHLDLVGGRYVRANGAYGQIFDGKNQDSDYEKSGRQEEFSRSYSKANEGEVFDASIGLGRAFETPFPGLELGLLIGYSVRGQDLYMIGGESVIDAFHPEDVGPIHGLHSSYKALWQGPWLGLDIDYALPILLSFSGSLEYHRTFYDGTGHWNLRRDFYRDFEHESSANGFLARGSLRYTLFPMAYLALTGQYQIWAANPGVAHTYAYVKKLDEKKNYVGIEPKEFKIPLNRVNWVSWSIGLSFVVSF